MTHEEMHEGDLVRIANHQGWDGSYWIERLPIGTTARIVREGSAFVAVEPLIAPNPPWPNGQTVSLETHNIEPV